MPTPSLPTQSVKDELTIGGLMSTLRRRRKIVLWTTGACFLVAVLVCIFMTRKYEAHGEIQVSKSSSDALNLDSMVSPVEGTSDALSENITLQTQSSILESDSLALRVIENLNLENTYDYRPKWDPISWALGLISPDGPKDPANVPLADAPRRREHALKVFSKHLKVKPLAGTRLIDVTYTGSDRKQAAEVVNQLTKALVDYTFETRNSATDQASAWLAGQLADVKKQAEAQQAKVVQLQRDAGVYSLGSTDNTGKEMSYSLTLDHLQQATSALTQAEATRILKGGIYEMVKGRDPELISGLGGSALNGASPAVNNSFNLLQTLRNQEATLASQLATDSSKYGAANPKLADERASLASIKQQVADEANRIGERAQNDYQVAQVAENNLRESYNREKSSAGKLNDKAIEYTIARQEADESRALYEQLFQRMKAAGVMEGLESTNVTVVDPGRVPGKPSKPNIPVYLGASIFVGLFLGSMAALLVDTVDDKIQSFKPITQELQVPLLGVLPQVGESRGLSLPLIKQRRLSASETPGTYPQLAVTEGPGTAFSEAMRSLRTSIQLPRRGAGKPPKVILVTSSVPNEGKSTVSANLAALLAQSGQEVLLIEGDMRHPSFAAHFGSSKNPSAGLSTVLSSSNGSELPAQEIKEVAGLHVLFSGPVPSNPSELLGGNRMHELVEKLRPRFDYIVIDSPPLLAVTDAVILSHTADMTLLIARDDMTTLKSLRRASEILGADDSIRMGVVLNGVSRQSASYDEYCGYSGDSYYLNKEKSVGV